MDLVNETFQAVKDLGQDIKHRAQAVVGYGPLALLSKSDQLPSLRTCEDAGALLAAVQERLAVITALSADAVAVLSYQQCTTFTWLLQDLINAHAAWGFLAYGLAPRADIIGGLLQRATGPAGVRCGSERECQRLREDEADLRAAAAQRECEQLQHIQHGLTQAADGEEEWQDASQATDAWPDQQCEDDDVCSGAAAPAEHGDAAAFQAQLRKAVYGVSGAHRGLLQHLLALAAAAGYGPRGSSVMTEEADQLVRPYKQHILRVVPELMIIQLATMTVESFNHGVSSGSASQKQAKGVQLAALFSKGTFTDFVHRAMQRLDSTCFAEQLLAEQLLHAGLCLGQNAGGRRLSVDPRPQLLGRLLSTSTKVLQRAAQESCGSGGQVSKAPHSHNLGLAAILRTLSVWWGDMALERQAQEDLIHTLLPLHGIASVRVFRRPWAALVFKVMAANIDLARAAAAQLTCNLNKLSDTHQQRAMLDVLGGIMAMSAAYNGFAPGIMPALCLCFESIDMVVAAQAMAIARGVFSTFDFKAQHMQELLPLVLPALAKMERSHWCPRLRRNAVKLLDTLKGVAGPELFDELAHQHCAEHAPWREQQRAQAAAALQQELQELQRDGRSSPEPLAGSERDAGAGAELPGEQGGAGPAGDGLAGTKRAYAAFLTGQVDDSTADDDDEDDDDDFDPDADETDADGAV